MGEHRHHGSHGMLRPELLGTAGGIVGYMRGEGIKIIHHTIETATGADALLGGIFLVGHTVLTVEFCPCAPYSNVAECGVYPVAMQRREVVCRLHSHIGKSGGISPSHSPHIFHWV